MAWNICLVSDNEAIQHLFTRTFAYRGDISIKSCDTADEALRLASNDSLHLMVISVNLPDKDGYDLCKELKEEVKVKFPVLLIEDIFEDIDLDRCLEAQTDGFIAKPFEETLVAEKIDEVLHSLESRETVEESGEDLKEMAVPSEEEAPAPAMLSAEEEEGILDLTDLVSEEEEAAVFLEEVEKEEMPPSIASALEESVSELEKMEAMEEEVPAAAMEMEEEIPEAPTFAPPEPGAMPPAPGINREEIEEIVREMVEQVVQKSLEEKLPGLIRESFAEVFADLSRSLK